MASNAFSGVGTTFKRGDGTSSETFTTVAEVNTISGPDMSRDQIDVTSLDSTSGYREFISGFRDGGTVELNMNFTLATYSDMKDDFESSTNVNYQIVMADTDATTLEFTGLLTALSSEVPVDDKVTSTVTIKIDGPVTLTT